MRKNTQNIRDRIFELRKVIEEHNKNYYILNTPLITDFEYDILMNELMTLEKNNPEFDSEESPSKKVGSDVEIRDEVVNGFDKIAHKNPMFSLGNTYDKNELGLFINKIQSDYSSDIAFSAELKFDGTAISITYKNGMLFRALTRGDGIVGEDVTNNVKKIPSLPTKLTGSFFPGEFEARGEIFMPWSEFERLNFERELAGDNLFANPRNAAAGSLKLLDSTEVAKRGLQCVIYQFVSLERIADSHLESLTKMKNWGLPVSEHSIKCMSVNEVFNFIDFWDEERKKLPFATDGAVIKVDDYNIQNSLGYTAKSPRWATAYKFQAEKALTRLLSVDFQVGRTGAITPVANLQPVLLSGSVIKRASLHNSDMIKQLDIRINDFVYIEKGGEIIPKIISVDFSLRDKLNIPVLFPDKCPDCGTTLIKEETESKHYCPNSEGCPTQIKSAFIHFCSRKAMNILAGDAYINQFFNTGLIRHLPDIYKITAENLLLLPGWKIKSAERFLKSLNDSKNAPFSKVLFALGIRYVGETTAKNIVAHFGDIEQLINADKEDLSNVEEVGDIIAESVIVYFSDKKNIEMINELKKIGLNFSQVKASNIISNVLEGKKIVISGNFSVSREFLKSVIEKHSGKNVSSISSSTDLLIAGDKAGPEKLKKAEKFGIKIVSEQEFKEIIDNKY